MPAPAPTLVSAAPVIRWQAWLLAIVLAVAGALVPLSPAAAAPTSGAEGSFHWGLKQSFRNYVPASGQSALGEAARRDDGTFDLPLGEGTYDPETKEVQASFSGGMQFVYAGHGFSMTLTDPRVAIGAAGGVLNVHVLFEQDGAEPIDGRVDFAALDVSRGERSNSGGTLTWTDIPTRLTEDGAEYFNGFYNAGLLIDPVSFSLTGDWPDEAEDADAFTEPGVAGWFPALQVPLEGDYSLGAVAVDQGRDVAYAFAASVDLETYASTSWIRRVDLTTGEELAPVTHPGLVYASGALSPIAVNQTTGAVAFVVQSDGSEAFTVDGTGYGFGIVTTGPGGDDAVLHPVSQAVNDLAWDEQTGAIVALIGTSSRTRVEVLDIGSGGAPPEVARTIALTGVVGNASNARGIVLDQSTGVVHVVLRQTTSASTPGQLLSAPVRGDGEAILTETPQSSGTYRTAAIVPDTGVLVVPAAAGGFFAVETRGEAPVVGAVRGSTAINDTVVDPDSGRVHLLYGSSFAVRVLEAEEVVSNAEGALVDHLGDLAPSRAFSGVAVAGNGDVVITGGQASTLGDSETNDGLRTLRRGVTPAITAQPEAATVTLLGETVNEDGSATSDEVTPVSFTVDATGEPVPAVRWQQRTALGWADLADDDTYSGVATPTLTVQAGETLDGSEYRAVATSTIAGPTGTQARVGAIGSEPATLAVEVLGAPLVTEQPVSRAVADGRSAVFTVAGAGTPAPTITWQRKTADGWADLVLGDPYTVDGGTLTVAASASLDGTVFRARLVSEAGEALSDEATLTVRAAATEPITYADVALEWTGSSELQHRPPNGSTANYFSAGVSDGTRETYAAESDGVRVLQRSSGDDAVASWETRGAHVSADGGEQVVRLTEGTATVQPDGTAAIDWPATFSVNFYDGLVPFAMTDLRLEVAADGTGTLTADLSGYSGDMSDPDKPKELAPPAEDVVVATFSDVSVDTADGFELRPDYAGVEITVPDDQTAQLTSGSGWGSWPQSFVDFHFDTGLAAYFYSTGGSFDPRKAPTAVAIDFSEATVTEPGEEPGGTDPGQEPGGTEPGEEPGGTEPGEQPGGTDPGEEPGGADPGEEPAGTDPGTTEPGGADPGTREPGDTDPGTTEPGGTEPGTTEPGTTDPGATDPGTTEPGTTDPGATDPGTTEPGATDPGAADPGPGATEPAGTTGAPSFTPEPPAATGDGLPEALRDAIQVAVDGRTVTISGLEAEAWHFGYVYSTPVALGWFQASADGVATTTLPESLEPGVHRIAVLDADGELVGWAEVTIADEATPAGAGPLAATGSGVVAPGIAALTLLLAGLVLVLAQRRRARQEAAD